MSCIQHKKGSKLLIYSCHMFSTTLSHEVRSQGWLRALNVDTHIETWNNADSGRARSLKTKLLHSDPYIATLVGEHKHLSALSHMRGCRLYRDEKESLPPQPWTPGLPNHTHNFSVPSSNFPTSNFSCSGRQEHFIQFQPFSNLLSHPQPSRLPNPPSPTSHLNNTHHASPQPPNLRALPRQRHTPPIVPLPRRLGKKVPPMSPSLQRLPQTLSYPVLPPPVRLRLPGRIFQDDEYLPRLPQGTIPKERLPEVVRNQSPVGPRTTALDASSAGEQQYR